MKSGSTRSYRQSARAEAAIQTGQRILEAATALWFELPPGDLTLKAIAERSGVSVQTVIRRFGSKEGVVEAAIAADTAGIRARRDAAPAGDLDAALDVLLDHYERDGDAALRTLAAEEQLEAARMIVQEGRAYHRAWCARVFAPALPAPEDSAYGARLDAFVAATDLYLWKLLRRDLGRSVEATRAALRALLQGLSR